MRVRLARTWPSSALSWGCCQVWDVGEDDSSIHTTLEAPGHRGGIRAVALAGDDSLALSAAAEGVKVWNARSGVCVRSLAEPTHGLCAMFTPGNRHAVVGSKVRAACLYIIA